MKTDWDYSKLADAYLKRPDYSEAAIDAMLAITGLSGKERICDVGAGVAHLTLMLAARGFEVVAVEPNDAMRANGIERTKNFSGVSWSDGTGENTGQTSHDFAFVSFGSSFNVCDRPQALKETARLLRPAGWFACMWNHRHLDDPIQSQIEEIIGSRIPGYGYGSRREDQTEEIEKSGLFRDVIQVRSKVIHKQTVAECVEAWRSHATLERQAGSDFATIIESIQDFLKSVKEPMIEIPYTTNIWMAQAK